MKKDKANKMKKTIIPCIFLLAFAVLPLISQSYSENEIISVQKTASNLEKMVNMNLDLLMEKDGKIYIIVDYQDIQDMLSSDLVFTVESQNFYPYNHTNPSVQGGASGDFHTYTEMERDLLALENTFPGLAKVFDLGDSLENRNIYALKISDNVMSDENEAGILFIGCHHAREWISVEVAYLLGKHLLENYETDPAVRELVNRCQVWILPIANPDGLEYSIYFYRYWRKNRRDNGDGSYGVDLNRNYDYAWGYDDNGSSPDSNSDVYRGESPFSEPETAAIRDFGAQHNFQAMISYHSYGQIILYPWGYKFEPSSQDALMEELARNMSQRMFAVNGRYYNYGQASSSLYTTNGDTTDWSFGVYGIPSFTIELPPLFLSQGEFFNAEEDILLVFNENLPAALYLIDWAIQNGPTPVEGQERIPKGKMDSHTAARHKK